VDQVHRGHQRLARRLLGRPGLQLARGDMIVQTPQRRAKEENLSLVLRSAPGRVSKDGHGHRVCSGGRRSAGGHPSRRRWRAFSA
jgi:hypothetical protein